MLALIKKVIRPVYECLASGSYREYLRLLDRYSRVPRFVKCDAAFYGYRIKVMDCLSFICQFEEIWMNEIYKFDSHNSSPLIYDCGANIGMSVMYYKKIFPGARIKAFESDPEVCSVLAYNLKRNDITDVEIINKAVWTENGEIDFGADGADGGSVLLKSNNVIKVKALRLKEMIMAEQEVDMLKMDIEGAEPAVVEDLGEALLRVKRLFIEYHSISGERQRLDAILSSVSKAGFRYYIQTVSSRCSPPFIDRGLNRKMDLQANIFAYKVPEN